MSVKDQAYTGLIPAINAGHSAENLSEMSCHPHRHDDSVNFPLGSPANCARVQINAVITGVQNREVSWPYGLPH